MQDKFITFKIDSEQQSKTQIRTKIGQIDAIISALYDTAMISVGNGDKVMYRIDTGQTKHEVTFSKVTDIINAIEGYERIRSMLQVKLASRKVRLMDSKNFTG
jgi:hypothetical protein